jgi:hypothetical protein
MSAISVRYDFSKCLINIFYPVRRASANKMNKRAACGPRAAGWTTLVYTIDSQMVARLSALRSGRTLLSRNIIIFMFLVLISVRGRINPRA